MSIDTCYFSILVIAATEAEARKKLSILLQLLKKLGFSVNLVKSNLEPSQSFEYLGVVWNTTEWTGQLTEKRQAKIKESAVQLIQAPISTCRSVARFLGRIQSADGIFPLAKARVRCVQWDFLTSCKEICQYDNIMFLSQSSMKELLYWSEADLSVGLPISYPESTTTLYTDACGDGIGIYFQGELISEKIPSWLLDKHINLKELYAVDRAVELFQEDLTNSVVTVRVDNNTALSAIKRQGSTRNWDIYQLVVRLLERCHQHQIVLLPIRISSAENLLADSASRQKDLADWKLHQNLTRRIFQTFGTPDIDLFVTNQSAQVPAYFTWHLGDPYARGIDALAQDLDWSQFNLPYAFLPFSLIPMVLQKAIAQKVDKMILVCPYWPSKTFFTILKNHAMIMYRLPFRNNMVMDLQTGLPPPNLQKMRLVVSLISGNPMTEGEGRAMFSNLRLENLWRRHGGQEQRRSTPTSGESGKVIAENTQFSHLPLL